MLIPSQVSNYHLADTLRFSIRTVATVCKHTISAVSWEEKNIREKRAQFRFSTTLSNFHRLPTLSTFQRGKLNFLWAAAHIFSVLIFAHTSCTLKYSGETCQYIFNCETLEKILFTPQFCARWTKIPTNKCNIMKFNFLRREIAINFKLSRWHSHEEINKRKIISQINLVRSSQRNF